MTDKIHINQGKVEEDARHMESAAACLGKVPLAPRDSRTTLPANVNSISAYNRGQDRISALGVMLDKEVSNIRSLHAAFAEFDEMIGLLGKRGVFYAEK